MVLLKGGTTQNKGNTSKRGGKKCQGQSKNQKTIGKRGKECDITTITDASVILSKK
jgi:hypothetical protein